MFRPRIRLTLQKLQHLNRFGDEFEPISEGRFHEIVANSKKRLEDYANEIRARVMPGNMYVAKWNNSKGDYGDIVIRITGMSDDKLRAYGIIYHSDYPNYNTDIEFLLEYTPEL
ncbi:MAG: hypothetical protein Q4C70_14840 [Planctomycetia bacterium]|nr:hypothetical protein [Planctomycetia bacterium]